MTQIKWEHYPVVAATPLLHSWLQIQGHLGLMPNTIDAYGRALEDYSRFLAQHHLLLEMVQREHIALYVNDLSTRPHPRGVTSPSSVAGVGLANATLQQRLTAVRLFYDYLMEEGVRAENPVGRGRYTPGKGFAGARDRALIPRYHRLPWIPIDEQWQAILTAATAEPLRNRLMLALAYDAALRREELCAVETGDIDPTHRLLHLRAETTKNHWARTVPYSATTSMLYTAYLAHRRELSRARGPLFLSESRRNRASPITIWTWSKVVEGIADRAALPQLTTHTFRHLCLTDLARAGWDLHEIATFAGHRNPQTTLMYIHLSGRDLAAKVAQGMASLHQWRIEKMAEVLT